MNDDRPTASPDLLAALIESTPERVRKRLDRTPDAAASWMWHANAEYWSVDSGGETVTLPLTHVLSVDQIRCTCLLSPRCFHVLACVTHLKVAIVESQQIAVEPASLEAEDDAIEVDEGQRFAAQEMSTNVGKLLRVGIANAGVVVQSGLLRAVHQCRAEGLQRLATLGLRVIAGTNEFRTRSSASDPEQLAEDVADVLETSQHIVAEKAVASFWIGTARRRQLPVRPRKLHGLFAEPIVTRSGFTGAAVYFLGEDDRIYAVSDVRPGEANRARDAYLGGIEMGPLIQPAKQLARGLYPGTDLTASSDGRLGRGKNVKIVDQGQSTWQAESIQKRFRRALADQWNDVYAHVALPADARPAGWDFVFVAGRVLGALGSELLFQSPTFKLPIRLAIANENESLCFRENLRILSFAPGLQLQLIARMNPQEPTLITPLAISEREEKSTTGDEPRLEIPKPLSGRVCLGFDEIQRTWLIRAQSSPLVLSTQSMKTNQDDPLGLLRRRWVATMLSGVASHRPSISSMLAAESATLHRNGFATGAALLDSLAFTHSNSVPRSVEATLATAIYLRSCGYVIAKARAPMKISSDVDPELK